MQRAIPEKTICSRISMRGSGGRRRQTVAPPVNKKMARLEASSLARVRQMQGCLRLLGEDHVAALDFTEHGVLEVDGLVVGLREGLVVRGDDTVDVLVQVLQRGQDLRTVGRTGL